MRRRHHAGWQLGAVAAALALMLAPAAQAADPTPVVPVAPVAPTAPAPAAPMDPAPVQSTAPSDQPSTPDGQSTPSDQGAPTPTDGSTPSPGATPDLGADPQEGVPKGETKGTAGGAPVLNLADPTANDKARAAAAAAVGRARASYDRAFAETEAARHNMQRFMKRAYQAEHRAQRLQATMGNMARTAYLQSDSDVSLIAELMDSADPERILTGASDAARIADHMEVRRFDALAQMTSAEQQAKDAQRLVLQTKQVMAAKRKVLDRAESLSRTVEAVITPPKHPSTVDKTTMVHWHWPTLPDDQIVSEAGMRMHPILHYLRCHAGSDINAAMGDPIYAPDDGIVMFAGAEGGYGNFTVIAHAGGITTGYGHQLKILVKPGEVVKKGQLIGKVGTTGLSTGPHLHFEVRIAGLPFNPRGWLEDNPKLRVPVC